MPAIYIKDSTYEELVLIAAILQKKPVDLINEYMERAVNSIKNDSRIRITMDKLRAAKNGKIVE
jgi:hypothetical protein